MAEENRKKLNMGKDVAHIALFTAFVAICSWIHIPTPVPFTLQTFALFLAVVLLGAGKGFLVTCIYLALGLIGVPVFSGFRGGVAALFSGSGGYLIGYFVGGLVMWLLSFIKRPGWQIFSFAIALLCYYGCGALWFAFVFTHAQTGVWAVLVTCVLPFLPFDILKLFLAKWLGQKLQKRTSVS